MTRITADVCKVHWLETNCQSACFFCEWWYNTYSKIDDNVFVPWLKYQLFSFVLVISLLFEIVTVCGFDFLFYFEGQLLSHMAFPVSSPDMIVGPALLSSRWSLLTSGTTQRQVTHVTSHFYLRLGWTILWPVTWNMSGNPNGDLWGLNLQPAAII